LNFNNYECAKKPCTKLSTKFANIGRDRNFLWVGLFIVS
jgi:hypothetical protein